MATIVIQVDILPMYEVGGSVSARDETEPTPSVAASPPRTAVEDAGEPEIIDLTGMQSATPAPSSALTPAAEEETAKMEHQIAPGESSSSATVRSATLEEQTPRPQSPVPEQSSDARAEASCTAQPVTPPRNSDGGGGGGGGGSGGGSSSSAQNPLIASRKRRQEDDDDNDNDGGLFVKKEESNNDGNDNAFARVPQWNTPRPVRYEKLEFESSDEDVVEISPFKRRRNDRDMADIPAYLGAGPSRRRQRSESPSPLPLPEPFYHPNFPDRPPLRCPYRKPTHDRNGACAVICETATSRPRNRGREYYRCAACPGFGGFICWADDRDLAGAGAGEPRCDCGFPARADLRSVGPEKPDARWFKCATDACRYRLYE